MKLPSEHRLTVAKEVAGGASVADTARRWGIHPETVRAICVEQGVRLRGSKVPAGLLAELAHAVAEGRPVAAVAAAHGVSATTVRRACREHGSRVAGMHHPVDVRSKAITLVKELGTAEAAARRLGLDPTVVQRWSRKAGVELDRRNASARHAQSKEDEIVALVRQGASSPAITRATGVSSFTVTKYTKRHGLARSPGRKKPIEARQLAELDARAAEIVSLAELTPRTRAYRKRDVEKFESWCEESGRDSRKPQALADYIRHLAEHGRSWRRGTCGAEVGSTYSTIKLTARSLTKWHAENGRPDALAWKTVKSALAWAKDHAPCSEGRRRRLNEDELVALASTPPPAPTLAALRARLVLFGLAQEPGADPRALSWSICALTPKQVTLSESEATLALPPHRSGGSPAGLTFAHRRGGVIVCGHCLVRELVARTSPEGRLCGSRHPAHGVAAVRRTITAATGRIGIESLDDDGLQRLCWHVEPDLVRWCRSQATAALLRSTGMRGAEVRHLDIDDVDLLEGRHWALLIRYRKNDQEGDGIVCRIDAEHAPGTALFVGLWLAVRGPAPGALLSLGGAPMSYASIRADLRLLAQRAGVSLEGFGGHSFRRTAISELLERGVFVRRVAGRIGIAPQTVLDYFEECTGTSTTELLGMGS